MPFKTCLCEHSKHFIVLFRGESKANKLEFKIAKLQFTFELEEELIKHIVILSGEDPNKLNPQEHFFNFRTVVANSQAPSIVFTYTKRKLKSA